MIRLFCMVILFVVGLFGQSAWAANATGSLCKQHLSMVTQILNREAVGHYWQINDEITNVIGISLNTISQNQSQSPLINGFINVVKSTVSQCSQNCEGVALSSGQTLTCSNIGERNILDLARYTRLIDESSIGSLVTAQPVAGVNPPNNNPTTIIRTTTTTLIIPPGCLGNEETETCREEIAIINSPPVAVDSIPMECLFNQNSEICLQVTNPTLMNEEPSQQPVSPVISSEI